MWLGLPAVIRILILEFTIFEFELARKSSLNKKLIFWLMFHELKNPLEFFIGEFSVHEHMTLTSGFEQTIIIFFLWRLVFGPCIGRNKPLSVVDVTMPSLSLTFNPLPLTPPPCVVASRWEIWNLTVEPNSNYANVSWRHNFPAGSSEFVLEFTLDSKKPDQAHWSLKLGPILRKNKIKRAK